MSRRLLDLNPAARLSVYEGVGHAPFYERPERFNRELAVFAAG
jgi:pimeloyl-ACP methyl ester carboxylesterase